MGQINFKPVYFSVFLFSAALLLAGCVPDEKPEAYKLYSAKCSACHRLLPPDDYPMEKLSEYIEKYGKEMTAEEKFKLLNGLREYRKIKGGNK